MWGDPQAARLLNASDPLAAFLWQTSGPAHVPLSDVRWQELLLQYNVLVHLEAPNEVVRAACDSMARHAPTSSNWAALALHASRMLRQLQQSLSCMEEMEQCRGQARATCGCLQWLRLVTHAVVVVVTTPSALQEALEYRSRGGGAVGGTMGSCRYRNAAEELLLSLLSFVAALAVPSSSSRSGPPPPPPRDESNATTSDTTCPPPPPPPLAIPEVYDAMVQCLQLLLVLLSTQLYQPMLSSLERQQQQQQQQQQDDDDDEGQVHHFFLDGLLQQAHVQRQWERRRLQQQRDKDEDKETREETPPPPWSSQTLLLAFLHCLVHRPPAPEGSIAHHSGQLAQSVAQLQQEHVTGPDGLYETHAIVVAQRSKTTHTPPPKKVAEWNDIGDGTISWKESAISNGGGNGGSRVLLNATKGVLQLSSSLLLLPWRLLHLALTFLGPSSSSSSSSSSSLDPSLGRDAALAAVATAQTMSSSLTRDVLWLTESPVADLANCLFLLLVHNHRSTTKTTGGGGGGMTNPFLEDLESLFDNRWNAASPLQAVAAAPTTTTAGATVPPPPRGVSVNFEVLFEAFGGMLHQEVGALLLYSLLQSCPIFAASLAVRSDLDTLVVPLLRTLYQSSRVPRRRPTPLQRRGQPQDQWHVTFRSSLHLYVVMILLLLFSQDASFGADAFRRVELSSGQVSWYKERHLRRLSEGSLLVLVVVRCLSCQLSVWRDSFVVSHACAVLSNVGWHMVGLHPYAAMRLASVTVACMKRWTVLWTTTKKRTRARRNTHDGNGVQEEQQEEAGEEEEEDPYGLTHMYGEVCRTLLQLIQLGIRNTVVDKNLHLVYALTYLQADVHAVLAMPGSPFDTAKLQPLLQMIAKADEVIRQGGAVQTAEQAMAALEAGVHHLKAIATTTMEEEEEDVLFTYEEEADAEIFFVPYIWNVTVCTVTATTMEWNKSQIRVFSLLEQANDDDENHEEGEQAQREKEAAAVVASSSFAQDVSEVV